MDKIWYRNPSKSEVIGRCDRDEKTEWPRRTDKSRMLKKTKKTQPHPDHEKLVNTEATNADL